MIHIPIVAKDNRQLTAMILWCYTNVSASNLIWDWDFGPEYPHDPLSVIFSFEHEKYAAMFALIWSNLATQN